MLFPEVGNQAALTPISISPTTTLVRAGSHSSPWGGLGGGRNRVRKGRLSGRLPRRPLSTHSGRASGRHIWLSHAPGTAPPAPTPGSSWAEEVAHMSQASAQSSWMDIRAPRVLRVSPLYRHGNGGPEHTGHLEEVSRERRAWNAGHLTLAQGASPLPTLSREVLIPAAGKPEEAGSGDCPFPSWTLSTVAV